MPADRIPPFVTNHLFVDCWWRHTIAFACSTTVQAFAVGRLAKQNRLLVSICPRSAMFALFTIICVAEPITLQETNMVLREKQHTIYMYIYIYGQTHVKYLLGMVIVQPIWQQGDHQELTNAPTSDRCVPIMSQ